MKRQHQIQFDRTIDGIIGGSGVRDIVCHVTPGGGKSTLPIQAGRLIKHGLADRICWICPRASLQDQAERNFIDPKFRQMFNHGLTIRSSTNQSDPCRGTQGFVTTYQAAAVDYDHSILQDFRRHRYILVADEFHHLAADGEWTEPIRELYDRAAYRVLMTGTLTRGDEKRIAFIPYIEESPGNFVTCCPEIGQDMITYTRRDALADRAIIPLEFHFADGVAEWQKESGQVTKAKLSTGRGDANQALYTALKTEYAQELLTEGVNHWQRKAEHCNFKHRGALLVVAASIESAKEYTALLKQQGLRAEIATSDDTPEAVKQIKALKGGKLKILVTVAMAYEGLDVPSISHIICLTNVRSMPWIEQMVARANRIDPLAGPYETQKGYIFAPADRMFVELARKIENDQCEAIARQKQGTLLVKEGGEGSGGSRPGITPLSSKLIQSDTISLFGETISSFRETMGDVCEKTQREIETELREEIDDHVRAWCRAFGYIPALLNRRIKGQFEKARENMTVKELERVKVWLAGNYQVPERRAGMGLERVRV
jgi:superfamily II DNA or RNA helicase